MNNTYYIIGMVFAGMSLMSAWVFIATRYHYLIKMLGISAIVGGTLYCWTATYTLLGYPIHGYPSDGSVIIAFEPHESAKTIDMWIHDLKSGTPRGYRFAYDPKLAKALKEGKEEAAKENAVMKFYRHHKEGEGDEDGTGNDKSGGEGGNGKRGGHDGKGKGVGPAGTRSGASGRESGFGDDIGAGFDIILTPNLPEKD